MSDEQKNEYYGSMKKAQRYISGNNPDNDEKVIDKLEKVTKIDDSNPTLYFIIGQSYANLNNEEKAIDAYKKVLEMEPNHFETNYNLASVYFNKGTDLYEQANSLPFDAPEEQYQKLIDESTEWFEKAVLQGIRLVPPQMSHRCPRHHRYRYCRRMLGLNVLASPVPCWRATAQAPTPLPHVSCRHKAIVRFLPDSVGSRPSVCSTSVPCSVGVLARTSSCMRPSRCRRRKPSSAPTPATAATPTPSTSVPWPSRAW